MVTICKIPMEEYMVHQSTTALGRILTGENLIERGTNLANWSCMCRYSSETVDHLLIHRTVGRELWAFIYAMFGVQWLMSRRVTDVLSGW